MPAGSTPSPSSVGFLAVRVSSGCCLPGTASTAFLQLVTMCDSQGDPGCATGTLAVPKGPWLCERDPSCEGSHRQPPVWDTQAQEGSWCCAGCSEQHIGSSVLVISSTQGKIQRDGAEVCCAARNTRLCRTGECFRCIENVHCNSLRAQRYPGSHPRNAAAWQNGEEGVGIPSEHNSAQEQNSLAAVGVTRAPDKELFISHPD